eukprot:gb/GECG01009999.1/.p1 GENE.gb/GECG01009999.1/~~gb/GECG01009999.1/.p1  ORF type:complete len:465 (+),score=98.19 gb/GECG01009999.1/:1-1395(+)
MSGAASPSAQPLSASSGTRGGEQGASHRQSSVSGHYHATTHTSTTEQGQGTSTFRDETTDVQQESQLRSLQDDIDRKQSNYINREREYRGRIEALEQELEGKNAKDMPPDKLAAAHMNRLRKMHSNIQGNVEHVQEQTARILQEQERDLLRAFRARLFDVQTELEKERSNAQDGAAVWIEKNRQLEKELEWAKEMADRLDRHNQALNQENSRLKTQFRTQEDDREYLIRQLVAAKKDNARLRQELDSASSEIDTLEQEVQQARATAERHQSAYEQVRAQSQQQGHSARYAMSNEEEERYKETIEKYKKLLEQEKRNLSTVRRQYANEVSSRTELERFFLQCVDDARAEIAKRKRRAMRGRTEGSKLPDDVADEDEEEHVTEEEKERISYEDFSGKDREKVLNTLLSHESLLSELHRRIFPPTGSSVSSGGSSPSRRPGGGSYGGGNSPTRYQSYQSKQGVISSP